jgi:glutamate/tyrosine decarboxylase-like PLP-dependent enzyme
MQKTKSEQYRSYAQKCLEVARSAADERGKRSLLHLAQVWFRMAQEAESVDKSRSEEAWLSTFKTFFLDKRSIE